jgi:hypothetical protein
MKKALVIVIIFCTALSCKTIKKLQYIYIPKIDVREVIARKEKIDNSNNPAYRYLISRELGKYRIKMNNVLVKDIIPSSNIDYNFCIIVSVSHEKGEVECYLYARDFYGKEDIETLARLTKGKSRINAVGDFGRFFTLLDETYMKIEILNAIVTIVEE